MNVDITDLTRRFGRTQAVAGVSLEAGPGVAELAGQLGELDIHAAPLGLRVANKTTAPQQTASAR